MSHGSTGVPARARTLKELRPIHRNGVVVFPVSADVHIEVQTFYAQQMRLLDALDVEGYAATFTEDGVTDHAHRGERVEGRAALIAGATAALPRYAGVAVRHWNDHYLIDTVDRDTLDVSYRSLVSRSDLDGNVTFEPTFSIEDVLVRISGKLYTRCRTIHRDVPAVQPAVGVS